MQPIITLSGVEKTYATGFRALRTIDLAIDRGEIFALLGPNGAGKSTLINVICGIVKPTAGVIRVDGHEIAAEYRKARALIGLVPQELHTDAFETVLATVTFSRGLFGKAPAPAFINALLSDLSLADKANDKILTLSGGMKRRVMIAKALAHEPKVLFLDEPTAGVDVELRRDMWRMIRGLKARGVTIILTTHYIEEAEELADRVGVIAQGEIILIERTAELMTRLGKKHLTLHLKERLTHTPPGLDGFNLELAADGHALVYTFEAKDEGAGVAGLIRALSSQGLEFSDLQTRQSTLEDIFLDLVGGAR